MEKGKEIKKLSDIPKRDIFPAPDGYFESLQQKIEAKAGQPGKEKVVPFRSCTLWYGGLAAAAAIALLIVFMPYLRNIMPANQSAEQLLAALTDEDCLTYLQNTDLEIEELLSLPEPELWGETLEEENVVLPSDEDLLYEQFGVTPDENLQML